VKRGVRRLIGAAIVATLVFALCAEAWILLLGVDEFLILSPFFVVALLAMLVLLGLLAVVVVNRFESYQARLRNFCVDLRQGARFARWRPSAIVSGVLALMCMALWVDGCCFGHYAFLPFASGRFVGGHVSPAVVCVGMGDDTRPIRSGALEYGCAEYSGQNPWVPRWDASRRTSRNGVVREASFTAPHWLLILLFSLAPVLTLYRGYRRYRREGAKCCLKCGYNLTGNVSGVCPECGAEVEPEGGSDRHPPHDS
jgi:hypothetical protein